MSTPSFENLLDNARALLDWTSNPERLRTTDCSHCKKGKHRSRDRGGNFRHTLVVRCADTRPPPFVTARLNDYRRVTASVGVG